MTRLLSPVAQYIYTPAWNDFNFDALHLTRGAAAPDLVTLFGAGGVKGLAFDGVATLEEVHGGGEILHPWLEGTDIIPHVHWMPTTADAGSAQWFLEYSWANLGEAFGATTTISVVDPSFGVAWRHQLVDLPTISGAGFLIGSCFMFRLYRDPLGAADDDYEHDAVLLSVGLHHQVDAFGSRQILVK